MLTNITGLPLYHLDREYYKPGWVKPTSEVWKQKILELCEKSQWIIDGNYISSLETRMQYADLLILLDVNRVKCLYRAVMRAVLPSKKHRSDMAEGCNERHDKEFYHFIWNFNKTTRPRIMQLIDEHKELEVVILRNNREIRKYLNQIR
jgi:adenylate kinase family enzyme